MKQQWSAKNCIACNQPEMAMAHWSLHTCRMPNENIRNLVMNEFRQILTADRKEREDEIRKAKMKKVAKQVSNSVGRAIKRLGEH